MKYHSFDENLAKKLGVKEAILFNLFEMQKKHTSATPNLNDLCKLCIYWTADDVKKIFNSLVKQHLI